MQKEQPATISPLLYSWFAPVLACDVLTNTNQKTGSLVLSVQLWLLQISREEPEARNSIDSIFKVDSIEQNVESTDVRVHEGTEQLRQAETYRNRARKKKFILCLIGVILLIILIIIIATNVN